MYGILSLIAKTVAGAFLSSSAKSSSSSEKSDDKKSNDLVSEIFNQFAGAVGGKGQGGGVKGKGGGGKGSGCKQN